MIISACPWSVCEVVSVPYVGAVVAVTVMRGGVAVVSAGHEYVGGTRGSGFVSSAADVLGISVVRGIRGVVGCVKCVCVWLGAV